MAKMFYTLDEAKTVLGRSEEDIKQFAREGRLREFRDGPRLMFKADQVEQLRAELGAGGDTVDLGVSDSGGMLNLGDTTRAGGGSSGSLSGIGLSSSASGIPLAGSTAGSMAGLAAGGTGSGVSASGL